MLQACAATRPAPSSTNVEVTGLSCPTYVNLIIWLVAGVAGGFAVGDFSRRLRLGVGNTGYGAIGGVVGALILQALIPDQP